MSAGESTQLTRYMVIENIKPGQLQNVYNRFHTQGRMLPSGLHFVDSWLTADGRRVFQIMETADIARFDEWMPKWSDLVDFEIIELGEKPK